MRVHCTRCQVHFTVPRSWLYLASRSSRLLQYAVQIAQKIKVLTRVYYNLTHMSYKIVIPFVYYLNYPCVDNCSKCYKIMYHACLILRSCACISSLVKFACVCFRLLKARDPSVHGKTTGASLTNVKQSYKLQGYSNSSVLTKF